MVDELLLAVHDPAVVEGDVGVAEHHERGLEADHDREGGRRDDVGMAGGPGGVDVAVHRVVRADRGRELGDLRPADLVDGGGRVAAPDQFPVQRHAPALSLG